MAFSSISGTGASPPEYMTTASAQFAPAPLRVGMYEQRHHQHHHQQQQPPHPPAPAPVGVGMWSSEPYKVDSGGGQATSGSTIMEGDTKFDHTGVSNLRIRFTVTKTQSFLGLWVLSVPYVHFGVVNLICS